MKTKVRKSVPQWVKRQLEMNEYTGQRKHSSQLSPREKDIIWGKLKSVNEWKTTSHALDRLVEKNINATYDDLVTMIDNSEIVEYKIDYNGKINRNEERVVLHSNAIVNECYNLKVVYSLTCDTIITVWINHINDHHETLKWELYNKDMKVFDAE